MKHRRVVRGGERGLAGQPREHVVIGQILQDLESVEVLLGQFADVRIGETAHDQVHFAQAAMPGPEQDTAAAGIEPLAPTRNGLAPSRDGHGKPLQWNDGAIDAPVRAL